MEEKESMDLEREKLEIERQKLDLEKQRFEFEKSKTSDPESSIATSIVKRGTPNILGIIGGIALGITPFLPWWQISSTASVLGNSASFSSSLSGFEVGHGYIIITCAIATILLSIIGNKYAFIAGGVAALDALSVMTGVIHISSNISGVGYFGHGDTGFGFGAIGATVAGLIIVITSFFQRKIAPTNKNENLSKGSYDTGEWIQDNRHAIEIVLLIAILLLDLVYNEGCGFGAKSVYEFVNSIWRVSPIILFLIGILIPVFLLWDVRLKRTFNVTAALVGSCMLIAILESLMGVKGNFNNSHYYNSHHFAVIFLRYFFNIWLLAAIVLDLWERRSADTIPTIIYKAKMLFNPFIILSVPMAVYILNGLFTPTLQNHVMPSERPISESRNVVTETRQGNDITENIMPSGTDENGWSYADYIIPMGYMIDSVYGDFTRQGYSNSDKDYSVEYCPNTSSFNGSTATYPFKYQDVEASLYQVWLDFTSLNYSAPGILRVRVPTNAGAFWKNFQIKLSPAISR